MRNPTRNISEKERQEIEWRERFPAGWQDKARRAGYPAPTIRKVEEWARLRDWQETRRLESYNGENFSELSPQMKERLKPTVERAWRETPGSHRAVSVQDAIRAVEPEDRAHLLNSVMQQLTEERILTFRQDVEWRGYAWDESWDDEDDEGLAPGAWHPMKWDGMLFCLHLTAGMRNNLQGREATVTGARAIARLMTEDTLTGALLQGKHPLQQSKHWKKPPTKRELEKMALPVTEQEARDQKGKIIRKTCALHGLILGHGELAALLAEIWDRPQPAAYQRPWGADTGAIVELGRTQQETAAKARWNWP